MTSLGKTALVITLTTIGLAWLAAPSKAQISIQRGYRGSGITYHNHYQRRNPHIYVGAPQTIVQPVQVIRPVVYPTLVNPVIVGSPVINSTLINPTLINSPVQSSTVIVTPGYQSTSSYGVSTYSVPTYGAAPGIIIYPHSTQRRSISISF